MPHAALWVVQQKARELFSIVRAFQCRTRLCGWCNIFADEEMKRGNAVSMPHAALWVVQLKKLCEKINSGSKFQCRTRLCGWCNRGRRFRRSCAGRVSMPHAALWVVQLHRSQPLSPYGEKGLLESLRKFERSDGKYVKYPFLFSCSLRRNPLRDRHLARP